MLWYIGKENSDYEIVSTMHDSKTGELYVYDSVKDCEKAIEKFGLSSEWIPKRIDTYPNK